MARNVHKKKQTAATVKSVTSNKISKSQQDPKSKKKGNLASQVPISTQEKNKSQSRAQPKESNATAKARQDIESRKKLEQSQKIVQFKQQIGQKVLSDAQVKEILDQFDWNVDMAVESYIIEQSHFQKKAAKESSQKTQMDQNSKTTDMFRQLISDTTSSPLSKLSMNGGTIESFFQQINVELEDPVALAIAASMHGITSKVSKSDVQIESEEPFWGFEMFETGCKYWSAFSIADWKKAIPQIRKTLKNDEKYFENIYIYAFDCQQDKGFKNIKLDDALVLWPILLKGKCSFLNNWTKFLKENEEKYQIIKRDHWIMFFYLIQKTSNDISKYPEIDDGSWPVIFDEFHEFMQNK